MRVHLSSALFVIGIIGLSGFLLPASALDTPVYATAVPTGHPGAFGSVTIPGQGSFPASSPLSSYLTPNQTANASVEGGIGGGAVEDNSAEVASDNNVSVMNQDLDAATPPSVGETSYDDAYADEMLLSLIAESGVPLMISAVQCMYAEHGNDTVSLNKGGAEMYSLAVDARDKAALLTVSTGMEPVRADFMRALEDFIEAGSVLKETGIGNASATDAAFVQITEGCSYLRTALQGPGQEAMIVAAASGSRLQAGSMPYQDVSTASRDALPLLERFSYDDPEGENMLSFMAESTGKVRSYTYTRDEEKVAVTAGLGRQFLLVVVKATNVGHKGDGDLYEADTPDLAAVTLHHRTDVYSPVALPPTTSLGESYAGARLERYESKKSFLLFDVPATLNVSEARLQVDFGSPGIAVWSLREAQA
ncbi:hypothetical protein ABH15_12260 [Methanoculleus taiwanensis]|uniref:Uncharacterized protein n=1 Tax=Methanoculleus taiwanensis TaxID=1550565 RepID=A0A498GYJ7_9EURY|nr:hypothetical protein [Methanoculleus taiwanensis]RXE55488.1 hypothetical protein ABH15_12260 [Methanoculleus taiwanensis]